MRSRARASFDMLSISALDLFASALGVFMLLSLMLFPFYLKKPALDAEVAAARATVEQAARARDDGERDAAATAEALNRARARLAAEQASLAAAQAAASSAAATRAERESASLAAAEARQAAEERAAQPPPAPSRPGVAINALDLVLVMDTTGSMRDELADAQAGLLAMIRILGRFAGDLRVGFVAYKDRGEEYVTRSFPLRPAAGGQAADIVAFVNGIRANGGGDDPEAVDDALAAAMAMPWRRDAHGRIVVIGDARARSGADQRSFALASQFRMLGTSDAPRSVSVVFTGGDREDARFFQNLARAGGGEVMRDQGRMMESVLLAALGEAGGARTGR